MVWPRPVPLTYIWDVVPHLATIFTADADDPATIHEACSLPQQSLDAVQFNYLIGNEYAATMYTSPEKFASQLKMYEIKPLYVLVLRVLTAVGANQVDSIIWLSLIPSLIICVILFLWLWNLTRAMQAALAVMLFGPSGVLYDSHFPVSRRASSERGDEMLYRR